jgi:hypothetical protein
MRHGVVLFCSALVALVFAAGALSAGPVREPVEIEPATFEGVCPFPVTLEAVRNNEILKDFGDHAIVTGRLFARVTNEATGESIVVNASGPAKLVFGEDSLTQYGRGLGLNIFFPGDLGPGSEGALLLTKGPTIQRFSESGLEVIRLPSNVKNLCDVLAG